MKPFFVLCLLLAGTNTFANYASTEYVQNAIAGLRTEINTKITQSTTTLDQQIHQLPIITHKIGESFLGGIVFYVDKSQQHGLVVSQCDIGFTEWRNGEAGDKTTNALNLGYGAGEANTRLIVAEQTIDDQEGSFAAKLAADYSIRENGEDCLNPSKSLCIGGWYLPSREELQLLFQNMSDLNLIHFAYPYYWSSSESSVLSAWAIDAQTGEAHILAKETQAGVLAVHGF